MGADVHAGANPVRRSSETDHTYLDGFEGTVPHELYEVICVVPSQTQTFDEHRGVRELFQAVLEGAIHDLRLPDGPMKDRAWKWIENGFVGDIMFNEACDYLGLDASAVRDRALAGLIEPPRRNPRGVTRRRVVVSTERASI